MEVWHKSSTLLRLWLFMSPMVSTWTSQLVGCIMRNVLFLNPLETVVDSDGGGVSAAADCLQLPVQQSSDFLLSSQ